jgi:hypothetical protein
MDKKTKLLLGAGVLAVGAYLLFKSKKSATANLVGFAGVKDRMKPMSGGGMINSTAVQGARYGAGQGIFANADSTSAEMKSSFYSVKGGKFGAGGGLFASFANQPFNFSGADAVGERMMAADGKFFEPRTARYGSNQGVFAPKKTGVEPTTPVLVNDKKPVNNLVGANGFVTNTSNFVG